MALRVLHAHGWVHRNITERTVLVCDDGRVMLTGLAAGAAEEALCGYDPVPGRHTQGTAGAPEDAKPIRGASTAVGAPGAAVPVRVAGRMRYAAVDQVSSAGGPGAARPARAGTGTAGHSGEGSGDTESAGGYVSPGTAGADAEAARRAAIEARTGGGVPGAGIEAANSGSAAGEPRALETGGDIRAARAGAIAAYRAGARAAARVQEAEQSGRTALPGARPSIEAAGDTGGGVGAYGTGVERGPATPPPGQIADPYGVRNATAWNGAAAPATGVAGLGPQAGHTGQARTALSAGGSGAATSGGADSVPHAARAPARPDRPPTPTPTLRTGPRRPTAPPVRPPGRWDGDGRRRCPHGAGPPPRWPPSGRGRRGWRSSGR